MCALLLCIWGPVYVLNVFYIYSTVKENTTEIKIDEQWIARVQDSIFRDFWNGSLFHFLSLACYYFIHWQCTHNNKTGGNNENEWPKIHMIWFWICDGYVVVVVVVVFSLLWRVVHRTPTKNFRPKICWVSAMFCMNSEHKCSKFHAFVLKLSIFLTEMVFIWRIYCVKNCQQHQFVLVFFLFRVSHRFNSYEIKNIQKL